MVKKNVELVEFDDDPAKFLKNMLNSKLVSEVKLNKRADGSNQAIVLVDPRKKGIVVGREGRNAEKARLLARRYFDITSVLINSPEKATMEWLSNGKVTSWIICWSRFKSKKEKTTLVDFNLQKKRIRS